MTQKTDLHEYLNEHGCITRLEAFTELGIVRARNGRVAKVMRYQTPIKILDAA